MGTATTWLWLGLLASALPPIEVDPELGNPDEIRRQLEISWQQLEQLYRSHAPNATEARGEPLQIVAANQLQPNRAGEGHPGRVRLLPLARSRDREQWLLALRHELAHQFLWQRCPAAAGDALFHESLALWTSGELERWNSEGYMALPEARKQLTGSPRLDRPAARRALARLLANLGSTSGELPQALARPLRRCADGARWRPMSLSGLVDRAYGELAEVTVVIDRHSGALIEARGPADLPMPYGSLLKPFVLAGQPRAPRLGVVSGRPEWLCGDKLPATITGELALLRSCNGYFLDWAERDPAAAGLGAYAGLLRALGLERAPTDMAEAIGIRPTLRLSGLALAQAYRALSHTRPDLIATLQRNAAEGTLAGLSASTALTGVAVKTGTVRDDRSSPRLGWLAAVDRDLVVVMARPGRAPRRFAAALVTELARQGDAASQRAVEVQVLGLVPAEHIEARCPGVGVTAGRHGPVVHPRRRLPLLALGAGGPALCLGAPWQLHFPDLGATERPYAGSFTISPPPRYRAPPGQKVAPRARLARQGSAFVFRTSRASYVAGVLRSEDASITGEAAKALAQVIAHNAEQARHPGRPLCDTTHCQVFQGSAPVDAKLRRALAGLPLPWTGWLPFSRGGDESWQQSRPRAQVAEILGAGFTALRFEGQKLRYLRTIDDGEAVYDEATTFSCEILRNRLRLPSCPQRAQPQKDQVVFSGRGEGHGLGLQVEQAKRRTDPARALLQRAYGAPAPPR